MTIGANLSQYEYSIVESFMRQPAFQAFKLQAYLAQEGVLQVRDDWKDEIAAYQFNAVNQGFMGLKDYENAKEVSASYALKSGKALSLSGILYLSPAQIAEARSNMLGVQKGLPEITSAIKAGFYRQIEGMVANGDASRYQAVGDPFGKARTAAVNTGCLNGVDGTNGTVITGGTGEDDDVSAAHGDFIDTFVLAKQTADAAGLDSSRCGVLMDNPTSLSLFKKRHATSGIHEYAQIQQMFPGYNVYPSDAYLEKEADDVYNDMHFMWFVFPFDTNGQPVIKMHVTKQMHVTALNGGALSKYDFGIGYAWAVGWKGGVIVKEPQAVIRTGALTL